jgi:hypothetical protein
MKLNVVLSAIGAGLTAYAYGLYGWQTWRRQAAPDKLAYVILTLLMIAGVRSSYELSDAVAIATMAVTALGTTTIAVLSWWRSGTLIRTRLTGALGTVGLVAAAASFFSPRATIVLVLVASLAASTLEIVKTRRRPWTEPLSTWLISLASQCCACAAAVPFGVWPALIPAGYVVTNACMCATIVRSPDPLWANMGARRHRGAH